MTFPKKGNFSKKTGGPRKFSGKSFNKDRPNKSFNKNRPNRFSKPGRPFRKSGPRESNFSKRPYPNNPDTFVYREVQAYLRFTKDRDKNKEVKNEDIQDLQDEEEKSSSEILAQQEGHEEEVSEKIFLEKEEDFVFTINHKRKQTYFRLWIVQALYALDLNNVAKTLFSCEISLDERKKTVEQWCFCEEVFIDSEKSYFLAKLDEEMDGRKWIILDEILQNLEKIDALIADNLKGWRFERLLPSKKAVLRLGIYLLLENKLPFQVVINEMVDLAKVFLDEKDYRFVNALLDGVYLQLK